jgi:hypothetical protein
MRSPYQNCGLKNPLSHAAYPISGSCPSWFILPLAPLLLSRQSTPRTRGRLGRRQGRLRIPVEASLGKQGPDDPSGLVRKRYRDKFVGLASHQPGEPCRQGDAAFRLFDDRRGAGNQQGPELAIPPFGDRSELLFSAAGVQARGKAQPGSEVAAGFETLNVVDGRPNSGGDQRADARDAGQAPAVSSAVTPTWIS